MASAAGLTLASASYLEAVVAAASGGRQCRHLGHRRHIRRHAFASSGDACLNSQKKVIWLLIILLR